MCFTKSVYYNYCFQISNGIFMCFLELCLTKQSIRFTRELYSDSDLPNELTLNSKYMANKIVVFGGCVEVFGCIISVHLGQLS